MKNFYIWHEWHDGFFLKNVIQKFTFIFSDHMECGGNGAALWMQDNAQNQKFTTKDTKNMKIIFKNVIQKYSFYLLSVLGVLGG